MKPTVLQSLARAQLALAGLLAAGTVLAGQASTGVIVKVKLATSSGVCGAVASQPAVQVACTRPGGPVLPLAGAVPYQRAASVPAAALPAAAIPADGVLQGVPVYSDGTRISSWRVVQLENSRYLELTIAW